jgi:N-acetyl-gamma-glutamyl-phosphate reductase
MKKIRVGIAGGAGYTGGELLRLLVHHPNVELVNVQSKSAAGKYLYEVHRDLLGDTELQFNGSPVKDLDVLFLCLVHGESKKFMNEYKPGSNIRIIDLSQDFRINSSDFAYGLPEWNRSEIITASNIANPGCFATAIQLALLPLVKNKLASNEIHVSATTGSSGAGQSLVETSHFSWRNNNFSSYKAFAHQHLEEIKQSALRLSQEFKSEINFIPHRGNFSRGIHVSLYTNSTISIDECMDVFSKTYAASPFVFVNSEPVDLKQVVNTNKCFLHCEKHGNKLLVTSIIDNLLKGASGQAVQNMNLMFGLEETAGLKLKSIAF